MGMCSVSKHTTQIATTYLKSIIVNRFTYLLARLLFDRDLADWALVLFQYTRHDVILNPSCKTIELFRARLKSNRLILDSFSQIVQLH